MFRKALLALLVAWLLMTPSVQATSSLDHLHDDEIHVLIIYSNQANETSVAVRKLTLFVQHFTTNVDVVSARGMKEVKEDDYTHIVYFGEDEQQLDAPVLDIIDHFSGDVLVIGENIEQFQTYESFDVQGDVRVKQVQLIRDREIDYILDYRTLFHEVTEDDQMIVHQYGFEAEQAHPLLMEKKGRFYFGSASIEGDVEHLLADGLHEFLPHDHGEKHVAYLRLEDIHPMSDPDKLQRVGEKLYERDIPFILVVIPVYMTPDTGERIHLADAPDVVRVLQDLERKGGTVIAHGYTNQYRETEEGFEFWDVENDQFITEPVPTSDIEPILKRSEFPNDEAYESYIAPLKENERAYIEERLEHSIHALVEQDLTPLAFEAPHYTMSQQGYEIVGNYFSTILGQVQYSDEHWKMMGAPPYETVMYDKNQMVVYPETIGYVDALEPFKFVAMEKRLKQTLLVRDSMIGGFYHPYLDDVYLDELLAIYEQVPHLKWLDLKEGSHEVKTDSVHIVADGTGNVHVESHLTFTDHLLRNVELTFVDKVLWGITAIVSLFVILFLLFTLYLRIQQRKRLFKERKING